MKFMPTMELNERAIYYAEHRSGVENRTLLYIHGAGASHHLWPDALLSWPDARTVAIDLPGHGQSAPPGRRSAGHYANFVESFIAGLNLADIILVGHSLGSAIALTVAQRHTVDLQGLILFGASARMPVAPQVLAGCLSSLAEVATFIAESGMVNAAADVREGVRRQVLDTGGMTTYGDFLACNRYDMRANLAAIDMPALIIAGRQDVMTPLKFSESLAGGLPRSQLNIIDDTGHFPMRERPDAIIPLMKAFLDNLRGSRK